MTSGTAGSSGQVTPLLRPPGVSDFALDRVHSAAGPRSGRRARTGPLAQAVLRRVGPWAAKGAPCSTETVCVGHEMLWSWSMGDFIYMTIDYRDLQFF